MSIDKYSTGLRATSPSRKYASIESDPYSPIIVEDLLQGVNEWRNIQDIVRLTFKALTDVVKAQGETLRELERQMPGKASKAEVSSGLSLKANVSDVSRAISDVNVNLENKLAYEDIQQLLKDYTQRTDIQYLLSNKASIDEVRSLVDSKVGNHELRAEIVGINAKLDEWYKDINKKQMQSAMQKDINTIVAQLELKANASEVAEALEGKANKQSVANALHRKANRSDVESLLARKVDLTDLQNVLSQLEQKVDISTLEKIGQLIDEKVDRSDYMVMNQRVADKVDKHDLEYLGQSVQSLRGEIDQRFIDQIRKLEEIKADIDSFKYNTNNVLTKKGDSKEIDRLISVVSKKADLESVAGQIAQMKAETHESVSLLKNEINYQRRQLEDQANDKQQKIDMNLDRINEELYKLNNEIKLIENDRRNDIEETDKFVKGLLHSTKKDIQIEQQKQAEDIENLSRKLQDNITEAYTKKLDKKEFLDFRAKVMNELDNKCELNEVQNALNSGQQDIGGRFMDFKEDIKSIIRQQEDDVYNILSKKANSSDVQNALQHKADNTIVQNLLGNKVNTNEIEDLKRNFEKLKTEIIEKITAKEFDQHITHHKNLLEEIKKEQLLKANIKDVCTLLDTKANIEDVNKALTEIHKELDIKANQEEINNIVNDQAIINESLCTENITGRWTWKSGDLRAGSMVPWEIQVINTLPDNFLWEKDKTSILVVAPGLYEITFGFYAKKKPTVQVLINGEPIISAVNTSSYVIHHTSGKLKDVNVAKHPSGNITGLTLLDFIVLPARARLSITYSGELGGEGFIGLRRL